jgi:hypothetical protein
VAHIEIDVGVIVRRRRPHALELLDADPDPVDALIVHEMGHERLSHNRRSAFSPAEMQASIVTLRPKR